MNISEKKAKIWRKDYEGKNGTYSRYSVRIKGETMDGETITYYMPVKFAKRCDAPARISNGTECEIEGFLSVESYKNKNGEEVKQPQIIVMRAKFKGDYDDEGEDGFAQAEVDIPF